MGGVVGDFGALRDLQAALRAANGAAVAAAEDVARALGGEIHAGTVTASGPSVVIHRERAVAFLAPRLETLVADTIEASVADTVTP